MQKTHKHWGRCPRPLDSPTSLSESEREAERTISRFAPICLSFCWIAIEWVYRLCYPKGDPFHSGFFPLRQTRSGAQVAPQRCPILRCGKSYYILTYFHFLERICIVISFGWGIDLIIPGKNHVKKYESEKKLAARLWRHYRDFLAPAYFQSIQDDQYQRKLRNIAQ